MYEYNKDDVFGLVSVLNAKTKQKGNELHFEFCPYCEGGGKDRHTFSINLDKGTFNCFRNGCGKQGHFVELARDCNYSLDDWKDKVYRPLAQVVPETKPKAIEYLESRGISENIAKKYNITVRNDKPDVLVFPFYDENNVLTFIKYRNIAGNHKGAKEWCEKDTKPILFGMNHCEGFEVLTICEGQADCLAVLTCGIKNVVSVPTGANGFTWLNHCWDWINKFKKVIVFGDYERGKITLLDRLRQSLRMPVYSIRPADYLHEKDANAILLKYGQDAVVNAINNAEIQELEYINRLSDVESVDIMSMPNIRTGIKQLDRTIYGMFFGQVILLSGKRGEGKSVFLSQLVSNAIEQKFTCLVYSGELPNHHFKNWLDLQIAGNDNLLEVENQYGDKWHKLKTGVSEKINKWYRDYAFIVDNRVIYSDEYEGLLKIIENAICRYSAKMICIDNLMTAIDGDLRADKYEQQSLFVKSLKKIAEKYDVLVILVAHPRKSDGDFDNDNVSGSADITNAVDVVMSYGRAKLEDSHDSYVVVTKNRLTGRLATGSKKIELEYSENSKRIRDYGETENKVYGAFKDSEGFYQLDMDSENPFT